MKKINTIYKATNKINNKSYIGFDSNWPKRKDTHFYKSSSNNSIHYHFHKALRKYGFGNFEWKVLLQSENKDYILNKMEPFYIKKYNSFKEGYNQTLGGDGTFGKKQSKLNKEKQSVYITERNKKSRWYNNGKINKFTIHSPGNEWKLGRLNVKPTTKNRKWFNNGIIQKLLDNQPKSWKTGMLQR